MGVVCTPMMGEGWMYEFEITAWGALAMGEERERRSQDRARGSPKVGWPGMLQGPEGTSIK